MSATDIPARDLDAFRALIEERSGICFDSSRQDFFQMRLREHLREKKLASAGELMRRVRDSNVEYESLLQRLLTQETSFFRYTSALKALTQLVLPEVLANTGRTNGQRVRIWSAGCSTGEEPYSIAIALKESGLFASPGQEAEILATDISRKAVSRALRAIYSRRSVANLTPEQIAAYFVPVDGHFQLQPAIRGQVSFVVMNLVQALYLGRMDCIFCMNVLMYFSQEHRQQMIGNFYASLEPGGYLFLGPAESLGKNPAGFQKVVFGESILYRKPCGGNGRSA